VCGCADVTYNGSALELQFVHVSSESCLKRHYGTPPWQTLNAYRSAEDTRTGKLVAIKKVANLFSDADTAVKVLRETKAVTHLQHDNVSWGPSKFNSESLCGGHTARAWVTRASAAAHMH
jgi:hypothetical protein